MFTLGMLGLNHSGSRSHCVSRLKPCLPSSLPPFPLSPQSKHIIIHRSSHDCEDAFLDKTSLSPWYLPHATDIGEIQFLQSRSLSCSNHTTNVTSSGTVRPVLKTALFSEHSVWNSSFTLAFGTILDCSEWFSNFV